MFEVVGVELTHHSSPFRLWRAQAAVGVHLCGEVVGATFFGVVSEIEYRQGGGGSIIGALVTVGVELADIDLTYIVVGELFEVALDMCRGERRTAVGEQWVDGVPR